MKTIIKKYQVGIFILLSFIMSWFPWYARIGPEVMTMGPSISAILVALMVGGWHGLIDLLKPFARWRVNLVWWAVAIFGPCFLYLFGIGAFMLAGGEAPPFLMIRDELHLIPLYLVMVVLMPWNGPVGEELGWRGFLLPRLQEKGGSLTASLVIGAVWGIWHLPSFFAPQGVVGVLYAEIGVIFIFVYILGTLANSVMMSWIFNKAKGSALVAGIVYHAAINFWAPVLLSDSSLMAAREGSKLPTIPANLYLTVLAIQVVAAVVVILATNGKLGQINNTKSAKGI